MKVRRVSRNLIVRQIEYFTLNGQQSHRTTSVDSELLDGGIAFSRPVDFSVFIFLKVVAKESIDSSRLDV